MTERLLAIAIAPAWLGCFGGFALCASVAYAVERIARLARRAVIDCDR